MRVSVIVEGETDRAIVETVLRSVVSEPHFDVVPAGGRSSAISLARSYFTLPNSHVALLVDAETVDNQLAQEQQHILTDLLAAVAPAWAFRVVLALPEIETCLFADPVSLANALGTTITSEQLTQARFEPKQVLKRLVGSQASNGDYVEVIRRILRSTAALKPIAECLPLKELTDFIQMAPKAEWIARGFRWPEKSKIELPDRSTITVEPSLHRSSLLKNVNTPRQASTLRFYNVLDASGHPLGEKSELEVVTMIAKDAPA